MTKTTNKKSLIDIYSELVDVQIEELKVAFRNHLCAVIDPEYDDSYYKNPSDVVHSEALEMAFHVKLDTLLGLGVISDDEAKKITKEIKDEVMLKVVDDVIEEEEVEVDHCLLQRYKVKFETKDEVVFAELIATAEPLMEDEVIIAVAFNKVFECIIPNDKRTVESYNAFHKGFSGATILEREVVRAKY